MLHLNVEMCTMLMKTLFVSLITNIKRIVTSKVMSKLLKKKYFKTLTVAAYISSYFIASLCP